MLTGIISGVTGAIVPFLLFLLTALLPGALLFLFISLQDWEGEFIGFLSLFCREGGVI